ncbi:MAG: hypothetical protein NTY51_05045 [Deltaproteobacteria bacterium]|nr:hypothetical protein [Deltaproteobacteria bacterium]
MLGVSDDRLDPTSEMLALSATGDTKNVLICLIELTGPMDVETMLEAARIAARKFPHLTRRIKEIRSKGFHYLVWDTDHTLEVPTFFEEMTEFDASEQVLDQILRLLSPRIDRNWDLFSESPAEFHLIKISSERYVEGWLMHHVAGDAATGTDVGQETLAQYHEVFYGSKPEWAGEYHSISGSKKRRVTVKKLTFRNMVEDVKQTFQNLFKRSCLPVGSGSETDKSQRHIKRILTEEQTEFLFKATSEQGVSFVDRLVVSANEVIDEWNHKRGLSPGLLTTSMTVNMRGRFSDVNSVNSSSLIFFKSLPSDRKDIRAFTKKVVLARIRHFRNQTDHKFSNNIKMMIDSFRIFPFRIRRQIISFLINRHQFSIGITMLGIFWPEMKNGRPTGESVLTRVGDLEVTEVFGVAHRMLSKTRTILLLYTFRNRLNLVLTFSAVDFTREESEQFMDLLLKNLMASEMFPSH